MFFGDFYCICANGCIPQKDLSNEVSYVTNKDNMTKLRPWEVGYLTNAKGAHKLLVLHLLGLRFWLFRV